MRRIPRPPRIPVWYVLLVIFALAALMGVAEARPLRTTVPATPTAAVSPNATPSAGSAACQAVNPTDGPWHWRVRAWHHGAMFQSYFDAGPTVAAACPPPGPHPRPHHGFFHHGWWEHPNPHPGV